MSSDQPIVSHDTLHLIATYDPEEGDESHLQKSLSRTISREDGERSATKSPNVYVDEIAGSDTVGIGTKQAPLQSIAGAFQHRGTDIHVFVKRRCVDTQTKYWVPTDADTSLDLMRFSTRERATEAAAQRQKQAEVEAAREKAKAMAPVTNTAAANPSAEKKSGGGFMGKLKKAFK